MDPRFAKKGVGGNMPGVYVPPWRLQLVEEKALVGIREPSPRKLPGTVLGIFKTFFFLAILAIHGILLALERLFFLIAHNLTPPLTPTPNHYHQIY